MQTEHIFILWSCIRIKRERFRASKTGLSSTQHTHTHSSFLSDRSKADPLSSFSFVCVSVASYMAFVFCQYLFLTPPSFSASRRLPCAS